MKIGPLEISLIDEWKSFYKLASLRIGALLMLLYSLAGVLLPIASDHWLELSPFALKFFPHADQTVGPAIGVALMMLARLTSFKWGGDSSTSSGGTS